MIEINTAAKKAEWGDPLTPEEALAAFMEGRYVGIIEEDHLGFLTPADSLRPFHTYDVPKLKKYIGGARTLRAHNLKKCAVYRHGLLNSFNGVTLTCCIWAPTFPKLNEKWDVLAAANKIKPLGDPSYSWVPIETMVE
jgi:hypothetical protein